MHHYKHLDTSTIVSLLWDVLSNYFGLKPYLTMLVQRDECLCLYTDATKQLHYILQHFAQ